MNKFDSYADELRACSETFVTLRIYHEEIMPEAVSRRLNIEPDKMVVKGSRISKKRIAQLNGWFLTSKEKLDSKDCRRHFDWLIHKLTGRGEEISMLSQEGFECYVSCFWVSSSGNGGPSLSPPQMLGLANLGLGVSWDIYFENDRM